MTDLPRSFEEATRESVEVDLSDEAAEAAALAELEAAQALVEAAAAQDEHADLEDDGTPPAETGDVAGDQASQVELAETTEPALVVETGDVAPVTED